MPSSSSALAPEIAQSLSEAIDRVVDASQQPIRAAFMARALNALARLAPEVSDEALGDATGAASDYAVLLRALQSPAVLGSLQRQDPLAAARLRGLDARRELLRAEGGTVSVEQAALALGITRQAVDKRRRADKLIGLSTGRRGYAYPLWQFGPAGVIPGLEDALAELSVRDPWARAAFFLSGDPHLDGSTPLEELRHGAVEAVCRAARAYGEHGAA
jgi:hypothetical protein